MRSHLNKIIPADFVVVIVEINNLILKFVWINKEGTRIPPTFFFFPGETGNIYIDLFLRTL